MKNFRRGFTMVELIFVIVIIGILVSIAMPKLAASRDDASIYAELASLKQSIINAESAYTADPKLESYPAGAYVTFSGTLANLQDSHCFAVFVDRRPTQRKLYIAPRTYRADLTSKCKLDSDVLTDLNNLAIENGLIETATAYTSKKLNKRRIKI